MKNYEDQFKVVNKENVNYFINKINNDIKLSYIVLLICSFFIIFNLTASIVFYYNNKLFIPIIHFISFIVLSIYFFNILRATKKLKIKLKKMIIYKKYYNV